MAVSGWRQRLGRAGSLGWLLLSLVLFFVACDATGLQTCGSLSDAGESLAIQNGDCWGQLGADCRSSHVLLLGKEARIVVIISGCSSSIKSGCQTVSQQLFSWLCKQDLLRLYAFLEISVHGIRCTDQKTTWFGPFIPFI